MSASPPLDPAAVRRVLLLRPRFLGDICLTLPALDAVRRAAPGARVAYLVEPESAPLLEGDPRVDDLIVAPRRAGAAAGLALARRLRGLRPDLAIDFFCNPRTALLTFASGARTRVGYAGKGWRSALYTHHARARTLSAVGFHLASLAALGWPAEAGPPRPYIGAAPRAPAAPELPALGVPDTARLVGFHPGARWPARRWARDRVAAPARRFLEADPARVAPVA